MFRTIILPCLFILFSCSTNPNRLRKASLVNSGVVGVWEDRKSEQTLVISCSGTVTFYKNEIKKSELPIKEFSLKDKYFSTSYVKYKYRWIEDVDNQMRVRMLNFMTDYDQTFGLMVMFVASMKGEDEELAPWVHMKRVNKPECDNI